MMFIDSDASGDRGCTGAGVRVLGTFGEGSGFPDPFCFPELLLERNTYVDTSHEDG